MTSSPYYRETGPLSALFNRVVGRLARYGLSLAGSAELTVRGRVSGKPQRLPVNPHTHEGAQYLVSARGHSQWVRNMRAAGGGELRVGRTVRPFRAVEVPDAEKAPVLRSYLQRWGWQVGAFFDGVTASSSDEEIARVAADHPVFRITVVQ
ncbi:MULTISPECIES: nitroreductase family deazaflavin-dependent oxidoreductase [Streptomyces]|uniref:Nitroreductase family deazaflavin-dependent oxidoreductase n=1 Tax=Streptomyces thermoviolaceus subsp. thermoviolaceus TaxID=66860 RepID=A0ABX0YSA0_STRTL|nr:MULTISPECIES: nitroreductase family deazaflavin-dependent oxidoreductase [Streptomyces]MCM3262637.1 nitroreductase family deazaflavin-dependent oxidoreductase [Streptomyces thermoviolaceus]NJP13943.1 nitroreductase family deazaflavin-dependent oxidoreductase [Streptomyces thermoviolaceus subsp. thermoviolaceus]RSS06641.1 nitroreductase family deazaflavin-dependent oxidoreductase [Streptomyces sp. WAC00469]WTD50303.1 nitroreductase family deazaflavin-dependent oxidoreductase [Streptomyces the